MPYVGSRVCHDADSHIMETADWMDDFLPDELKKRAFLGLGGTVEVLQKQVEAVRARAQSGDPVEGEDNPVSGKKGWMGLGGFDMDERRRAIDAIGVSSQLVFNTTALGLQKWSGGDDAMLYEFATANNKAMGRFCTSDPRMIGVAFVPLNDPAKAVAEINRTLDDGCGAIMVSAEAAAGRSPGHPDLDCVWKTLCDRDAPFMLHIGPGTKVQPKAYHNNGRERAPDLHGGGENLRFCDYMMLWYAPQMFMTAMVYDGVFERFPALRGGVIESGAGWVPDFLRQLDMGYSSFVKSDPYLKELSMKPSDYIRRAVKFTPFPGEDVGLMIKDAGADLFLFSTDYPHPEGTKDPLGKFERYFDELTEEEKDKFYRTNFEDMMGAQLAPALKLSA
ncbi:MAG: amidohydrolase family protein [Alphaproteobacteria bacterium]